MGLFPAVASFQLQTALFSCALPGFTRQDPQNISNIPECLQFQPESPLMKENAAAHGERARHMTFAGGLLRFLPVAEP